jgi:hypothetical protein
MAGRLGESRSVLLPADILIGLWECWSSKFKAAALHLHCLHQTVTNDIILQSQ